MTSRRRQLLRLATSDQPSEELLDDSDNGAWKRLQDAERRIRPAQLLQAPATKSAPAAQTPLCPDCHQADRQYLLWRLPKDAVQIRRQAVPTTAEWARAVTRAAEPGSLLFKSLLEHLRGSSLLAFDQSEAASRLLADVAGFLSELTSCQLSAELPAVFGGASITLIGGWAQETALAAEFPVLDFVVSLPEWARTCRLCLCQVAPGRNGSVAVPLQSEQRQQLSSTGPHKACAQAIEAAVLHRVHDLLRPGRHPRLMVNTELGCWRQSGKDWPPDSVQAKKLRLNLTWSDPTGQQESRPCGVNIWFGIPVLLLTEHRLRGHLLLAGSEPRLLRLAVEERRWALGRSRGCDDPVPLLCRAVKFVLKLAEYLAEDVSMTGEHRRDPGLAFGVNSAVRELTLRFDDCREAFAAGANLQDRLLELLRGLLRVRRAGGGVPAFTEAARIGVGPETPTSPLSESAGSIIRYLERACQGAGAEDLLPTMLQYFRLKNQPDCLRHGDDKVLSLATQISFDLLTMSE